MNFCSCGLPQLLNSVSIVIEVISGVFVTKGLGLPVYSNI